MTSDEQKRRPHRGARIFVRVLEFVAALIVIVLLTIHIPGIQGWIGKKLTEFVSVKTGGSFEVERLSFDLGGCLELEGLEVLGPDGDSVLIVNELSLKTSIGGLLQKRIVLNDLELAGFYGRLESNDLDLNIDFIIDAFASQAPRDTTSTNSSLTIVSNRIELTDIDFEFSSEEVVVGVILDSAAVADATVRINPNEIDVSSIYIDRSSTRVTLFDESETGVSESVTSDIVLPGLDLSSGFAMQLDTGGIHNSDVHVHFGATQVSETIDPEHLDFSDISIYTVGTKANEKHLTTELLEVEGVLPWGDRISTAGGFEASPTQLSIDTLGARMQNSYVELKGEMKYPEWQQLLMTIDENQGSLELRGRVSRDDLVRFSSTELPEELSSIESIRLGAQLEIKPTLLDIRDFSISTEQSSISGSGKFVPDDMYWSMDGWNDFRVDAELQEDVIAIVEATDSSYILPNAIDISLASSGSLDQFSITGELKSSFGDISVDGDGGLRDSSFAFDVTSSTREFLLSKVIGTQEVDSFTLRSEVSGVVGADVINIEFDGIIDEVVVRGQRVTDTYLDGRLATDSLDVRIAIEDSLYRAKADVLGELGDELSMHVEAFFEEFHYGSFVTDGSRAAMSGQVLLDYVKPDSNSVGLSISLDTITLATEAITYELDSLRGDIWISSDSSKGSFVSDVGKGSIDANFDVRLIESRTEAILDRNMLLLPLSADSGYIGRKLGMELSITERSLLELMSVEVDEFSGVDIAVNWDEEPGIFDMQIVSGRYAGEIDLDTLALVMNSTRQNSELNLLVDGIEYDSFAIGKLYWEVDGTTEGLTTRVSLGNDSLVAFGTNALVNYIDRGFRMVFDSLVLLDQVFLNESDGSMYISLDSLAFDSLRLVSDGPVIQLNGNRNLIQADIADYDLRSLNYFIDRDSNLIESGDLNLHLDYNTVEQNVAAEVLVDSMVIGTSAPLQLSLSGANNGTTVPFTFNVVGDSNTIRGEGTYDWIDETIRSDIEINLNKLSSMEAYLSGVFEGIKGSVKGTTTVRGNTDEVRFDGDLNLRNVVMDLRAPRTTISIANEEIVFDERGIELSDFQVTDGADNPLTINGELKTDDYRRFEYFLDVTTDRFTLLDNQTDKTRSLQGLFVVASNIELRGDSKDATINATVDVDPSTDFTLVMPEQEVELMTSDGIVEFVDPNAVPDSLATVEEMSFIDSLVANLPDLDITAAVKLQEDAKFTIVIDPVSGDLIQARGNADLDMRYDRTGNAQLNGAYEIKDGFYELSFYDIVRKRFELVEGSRVDWSGIAEEGTMNITARQTIKSSSIGLIGHEIGEDQRSIYRRSLPYEVSIFIKGQLDAPEVSFGLDLPDADKASYPVLASKLSRLSQPEFESELNKQVFGLLVLGGFIPQTSGSDFDEMAVATTAIANSVNGLLTAQLNRLTNKIEGVDINIGLQSYTDYQTGAGNATRTAMDFRVSKRLMEDRLTIEVGGEVDLYSDQSGVNTGDGFRGDVAVIYDLTESGNKKLKAFNNETYDIIYHEVRNTGIALIFIREFDKGEKRKKKGE